MQMRFAQMNMTICPHAFCTVIENPRVNAILREMKILPVILVIGMNKQQPWDYLEVSM